VQVVWGFGHTHWSSDNVINSTRVVSNQCGYITQHPSGKGSNFYDLGMVVDIAGTALPCLLGHFATCAYT
jgi:hypothetical protein